MLRCCCCFILFHVVSKVQLKIDNYDKMVPELLKAFAEPGTGIAESMLDFRRVLEDQLRRFPVGEFCPYGTSNDFGIQYTHIHP